MCHNPWIQLTVLLLVTATGCDQSSSRGLPSDGPLLMLPQSTRREVDLLMVIDNSRSMADEQSNYRVTYFSPLSALKNMIGGLPDIHLGVISTDVGTANALESGCDANGDGGRLLTGSCTNPVGAPYIVDVAPRGCEIQREPSYGCSAHACGPEHCAHEPSTTFVMDTTGCPRCRNYSGESLEDVFACIADLGTQGCNWEQPLESLHRALAPDNTHNAGFLRESSVLGIFIISDEDDCSASDPLLFSREPEDLDGPLGPFTSFRCFEQGITCDVDDRVTMGTRHHCVPRDDEDARLHGVDRYVDRLDELKLRQLVSVAVLAGPVLPSASGEGFDVEVQPDDNGNPMLQWSCTITVDGAAPGIRLRAFAAAFNEPTDLDDWAFASVCDGDLIPSFTGIGNALKATISPACLPAPLKGCADPGVLNDTPRAAQTCAINDHCLPTCTVTDLQEQGLPTELEVPVPPCLEVAEDGTLIPGNTDRFRAYASGLPNLHDGLLPVPACWFITYQEQCESSRYAELLIARRQDPPPRTVAAVLCDYLPLDEHQCGDGVDEDEDCLVDLDDPCCQNLANCETN